MAEQKNNQQEDNKPILRSIRTFKADAEETIRGGKVSLADVYIRQEKQKPPVFSTKKQKLSTKVWLVITAVIFLSVGAYFIFLYLKKNETQSPSPVSQKQTAVIANSTQIPLTITDKENFKQQITQRFNTLYDAGDIVQFTLNINDGQKNEPLTSKKFLELIKAQAPVFLSTFLENTFFLGIINLERNHPVFILKTSPVEYESVFAGMLKWEGRLIENLDFLLAYRKDAISATSTSTLFKDRVIKNQNARVIETKDGVPIFIYSLFNRQYIIITDSVQSFEEMLKKQLL